MNTWLPYGSFIGTLRREIEAHGFRFGEVLDLTDGEVSKHTHEDAHFCFIVQGDYISRVKDREGVRAASTMLFHPAGTTHCDRFYQRGGRFLTVSITPERLDRVRDHVDLIEHSIAFADAEISWLGTRLYRELQATDELSPVVMEGMALELLAQDASLAQIALESGFADQSQFTKSFKRATGLTPGEYRKLLV